MELIQHTIPRISLVTVNFNMASTLETTLRSVVDQQYAGLEYVVIDGGSTDGSVEIIRRYENRLASWISQPDGGMYDALNRGFAATSGEIMGWLNSDDLHMHWTLSTVAEIFSHCPQVEWITSLYPLIFNEKGHLCSTHYLAGFNRVSFMRGANLPRKGFYARGFIQQESTFWRRSLWERAGSRLDTSCGTAGDFELWTRFFQHANLAGVAVPLAGFRQRRGQISMEQREAYLASSEKILTQAGGRRPAGVERFMRRRMHAYMGHRPLARHLPAGFRNFLFARGLISESPVIRYADDRWRVDREYIV